MIDDETSKTAYLSVTLVIIVGVIAVGLLVLFIGRKSISNGFETASDFIEDEAVAKLEAYDQKVVTGTQVKTILQESITKPYVVLVANASMNSHISGVSASLNGIKYIKNPSVDTDKLAPDGTPEKMTGDSYCCPLVIGCKYAEKVNGTIGENFNIPIYSKSAGSITESGETTVTLSLFSFESGKLSLTHQRGDTESLALVTASGSTAKEQAENFLTDLTNPLLAKAIREGKSLDNYEDADLITTRNAAGFVAGDNTIFVNYGVEIDTSSSTLCRDGGYYEFMGGYGKANGKDAFVINKFLVNTNSESCAEYIPDSGRYMSTYLRDASDHVIGFVFEQVLDNDL